MNKAVADAELRIIMSELDRRRKAAFITPDMVRDESYPEQDKFVMDEAPYLAAQCTRRAGKSNGLGLRFARTMLRYPGCLCPYVALTRESAKNIMWPALHEIDLRFKLGAHFTDSQLRMTLPNGSSLQLFGADMKNFIRRLKGIKTPGAGIDEVQDFADQTLRELVEDVIGPALVDYKGSWLALTGTPGSVPVGYFYELSELAKHGFAVHKWSLFDNPYLPNARSFVNDLKQKRGWTDDNPTLQRQYYNRWVLDMDSLVIKYSADINDYNELPKQGGTWSYIIGVDIGYHDADAIAVVAFHKHRKEAYLVEEIVQTQQGITELAVVMDRVIKDYSPDRVVMDTGGLGKKIAEEMRKRYSLPVTAAEKSRKTEFLEILNDALRIKKFFAKSTSRFVDDAKRLQWDYEKSGPDKMVISDNFHSDIIDAVLYAFRESMHWLSTPELVKPKAGTNAWFAQQEDEQIEILENRFTKKKEDDFESGFEDDPWAKGLGDEAEGFE